MRKREEVIMDFCRNTLPTLGATLIVGLGFFSGALAQSGNPIRIGMSLALTGAGASPSKVVNTALDLWRDDINAKGGLLGRPVELVIYDDQSAPAGEKTNPRDIAVRPVDARDQASSDRVATVCKYDRDLVCHRLSG
jgi:ABC-type branched-subunit amino acid transport system substrate-binding protein